VPRLTVIDIRHFVFSFFSLFFFFFIRPPAIFVGPQLRRLRFFFIFFVFLLRVVFLLPAFFFFFLFLSLFSMLPCRKLLGHSRRLSPQNWRGRGRLVRHFAL